MRMQAKKIGKAQKLNGESLPLTDGNILPTVGSLSKGPYGTGRIPINGAGPYGAGRPRGLSSE